MINHWEIVVSTAAAPPMPQLALGTISALLECIMVIAMELDVLFVPMWNVQVLLVIEIPNVLLSSHFV